jgi:septum formation protein
VDLVLASTSPQRRAILTTLGVPFSVEAPDYDEVPIPGTPEQVVQERALGKARSVAAQTAARPVLGVDTEVVVGEGEVLGQPADARAARAMLAQLAGREHRVLSGIALLGEREQVAVAETRVRLVALDDAELDAYVARGEWRGRAGGYAIQETGAALVQSIVGDYANVVGLPVALLGELLAGEGISLVRAGGNGKRT